MASLTFDLFGIHKSISGHEDDASADQWLQGTMGIP